MAKASVKKTVKMGEDEYVEVDMPPVYESVKPAVKCLTVHELMDYVDKYKSLCEYTNVCSVHKDGDTLVLS